MEARGAGQAVQAVQAGQAGQAVQAVQAGQAGQAGAAEAVLALPSLQDAVMSRKVKAMKVTRNEQLFVHSLAFRCSERPQFWTTSRQTIHSTQLPLLRAS